MLNYQLSCDSTALPRAQVNYMYTWVLASLPQRKYQYSKLKPWHKEPTATRELESGRAKRTDGQERQRGSQQFL